MTGQTAELPRWDMTGLFGPEPDASERAFAAALAGIDELQTLCDRLAIGPRSNPTIDAATIAAADELIAAWNRFVEDAEIMHSYLYCLISADTGDRAAQAAMSELQQRNAALATLRARLTAWIGSLDVEALIAASTLARDHAFALRDMHRNAAHLMSPAEEALAAELASAGAAAWFRLREDVEASLAAPFEVDGERKTLSLTEIENYFPNPNRELRVAAFRATESLRESAAIPFVAAINGVKGEQIALTTRRHWRDPLDAALAAHRLDRATLDVMLAAIRAEFPALRRFLTAKARALGLPNLASYDLSAPVSREGENWPWERTVSFVSEQFAAYSPKLAAFAQRAFAEAWIDVGPRPNKVGGGYCSYVGGGRSRILFNYAPTYYCMSGTAHELGHAYHGFVMHEFGRTWLQGSLTPPTLAETASTFCETLVQRAALAAAPASERMELLNGVLQTQCVNVFYTTMMFDLERAIMAARAKRQLAHEELIELALSTQRDFFAGAIDEQSLARYQWAHIPHFFLPDLWYYNFPYAFGMLFGLGLYARYEAEPAGFPLRFDALLADTGTAAALQLAARFGIDLHAPAFWHSALAAITANIAEFDRLVPS